MLNQFIFKINVQEEWINYNNQMQAYCGLAFRLPAEFIIVEDCSVIIEFNTLDVFIS